MPTYTYRCTKCGEEYEAVQSMSDPPLKRCKKCRGALRRTFHPVGIVLKGSGFHRNDYRSKSASREDKESSSDGEKKDTSKTESPKTESSKKESSKRDSKTESKSSGSDS